MRSLGWFVSCFFFFFFHLEVIFALRGERGDNETRVSGIKPPMDGTANRRHVQCPETDLQVTYECCNQFTTGHLSH